MLFVGIGRCLTTLSPPRNRACDVYRTRLLGLTLWAWSLPPKHGVHTLTVYGYWKTPISTFSQPLGGFTFSRSEASCSTSAPFQVRYSPIQPVMPSRCLSAAGLRFLEHPVPPEAFRRSYVWPTDRSRPATPIHVKNCHITYSELKVGTNSHYSL